jgi:phospholipid/cholesterol/gamma-HCH transport system permease protein
MSEAVTAPLVLEPDGDGWRLLLSGDWSLAALPAIEARLDGLPARLPGNLNCDWTNAAAPGISPAWALLERLGDMNPGRDLSIRHTGNPPHFVELLQRLQTDRDAVIAAPPAPEARDGWVGKLGRWSVVQGRHARGVVAFFGRIAKVIGEMFSRLQAVRVSSLARHVYETGITAIPIVSLIAFLISVIVAYLGAQQLSRFGADIFVVDLVTIAVLREMGVLLTAIIVAGRSGSAFAAEIGVMQLNEETDALRAMGMNPIELLVVPRVIALMIALPLLTVIADAMGLAGGGLLSLINLHIPLPQFTARLRESLSPTTFWAGLIKAPVFAVLIAMVGTYRGMQVRDSARELGRLTTVAVVQSIFMVILADALFAVLFVQIHF